MMDVVTGDQVVEEELSDQEEVSFSNTPLVRYFIKTLFLWFHTFDKVRS